VVQAAWAAAQKKSLHAAEQDRPDVAERRAAWHEQLNDVDPARLVFLDESGSQTSMTRTRGRAPRGQRVVAKVPGGHWKIVTMISAIRTSGPFAAASIVGATDSEVFRTYIREILAPQLRTGDVVVMDNLTPHKAPGVREAIESVGAELRYLPPYSPDFNPIENMWSKVKGKLRSLAARSIESLHDAIGIALATITPNDCIGFFRHCKYFATSNGAPV
jgi:transposase